jgi:O-antigen ligase
MVAARVARADGVARPGIGERLREVGGPNLAAILLFAALIGAMSLRLQPMVLLVSGAALALSVVAPRSGLLILALVSCLRPPAVPSPGLPTLLVGSILLGAVFRLPLDRPTLRMTPPLAILAAFTLYVFIGQLPDLAGGYSGDVGHLVGYQFIQVGTGFALVLALAFLLPGHDARPVVAAAIASAAIAGVIGIASASTVNLPALLAPLVAEDEFGGRAVGTFGNPNYFGMVEAVAASAALTWVAFDRSRPIRAALLAAATICTLALLLSLSRGAVITLLAGVAMLAFARYRLRGVAALVVILVAFVTIYPVLAQWRLGDKGDPIAGQALVQMEESDRERAAAVLAGPKIWATAPVFGVGFGHYSFVSAQFSGNVYATASHNWYINVLAEEGLVGIVLWLAFLLAVALTLRRLAPAPRAIGLTTLTAFAVGSVFLEPPNSFQTSAVPILVIGGVIAGTWLAGSREEDRSTAPTQR